ncbi:LysR substrate-binding domain-containing protein [Roseateles sp.]|uniref:LysR substrate-binding domain-containing protein n=1 Tax=Roseateles sp. TaxID=1971397 RepID=UPI0031D2C655
MRLTQLRSFHAVAATGSFTRAAERLHVSQPTVTTQVAQLEALYRVELFHRGGRQVRLTGLGERLLQLSRQIFGMEAEAVQLLRDEGELRSGHLRVAAVGPHHVTRMLMAFHQRHPGVSVSVSTGNSQDVLDRLLAYEADVGVLAQASRDRRFAAVPYSEHPVLICCNGAHRFARRRSIGIAELRHEKLLMREQGSTTRLALETALQAAGVAPDVVMEIASREIIREAVMLGAGVAAVSAVEFVPGRGLHAVSISDARVRTCAHLVCLAERRDIGMVRVFMDLSEAAQAPACRAERAPDQVPDQVPDPAP